MNIVFFGAGTFGLPTLSALASSRHRVLGVVTSAEKRSGRGLKVTEPPVGELARQKGIDVWTLGDVNSAGTLERLRQAKADVFVVVSFGSIFSEGLLSIPKHGCVNLHGSLLPRHRGAAPIVYAILAGDREAGVTTMRMNRRLDAGDILLQEKTPIAPDEDARTITDRLAALGAPLVVRTLDGLENGTLTPVPQDDSHSTLAPKLRKEDAWIDWSRPAEEISRRVRAFAMWPGAKTSFSGKEIGILSAGFESGVQGAPIAAPGTLIDTASPKGLCVAAGSGMVLIRILKPEGRAAMSHRDFVNGYRLQNGSIFGGRI